jgi:membrane protease YdiL (CAAX protease family)
VRIVLGFALGALTFAAAWLILRAQGQGLSALGWRTPARWPGWVAAGLLAILFIGFVGAGPLRGAPVFSDASPFRIFGALVMALIGGVFEESVFRGFVIGRARDAGLPTIVQVLASGFLFGLAHVGWGGLAGGFSVGAAVAAMVSTGVLGLLLAGVYLSGGRSLWPCMAAHALINLAIEPWLILSAISGGFGHP